MNVKGVSIRNFLNAIEPVYGADALLRVRSALPPEVLAQLEPVVLASSFYPVEVSAAIHEAVRSQLGNGSVAANRKVGAHAARDDFGGIYRVFIRIADYRRLLEGLGRAWRQYNSAGFIEWASLGEGEAHGFVREVSGFTEAMWHSIAARLETILVLGGAKQAAVSVTAWSAKHLELRARWTP